jgi:hypothetical protein
MHSRTRILATIASCVFPAVLAAQDTVTEQSSKVPFPTRVTDPAGAEQVLMGMGLRTRTILKVKVYAFGLYVDSARAKEVLSAFAGRDHKALRDDQNFYDALLEGEIPMTLRLVMTRDVGGSDMADAFDGALRPRVERAAAEKDLPGGVEAQEQFRGYFNVEQMTKESELLFTCTPDGMLSSTVKGKAMPPIASRALFWALFDVYLGAKPISGDGKKNVIANFPQLLGAASSN